MQQMIMEPGNGPSSLESHGRHMASSLLMRHNTFHYHFIVLHAIWQRRYPVDIKQPSTSIICSVLALAFSMQYCLQHIGKTSVKSCMVFGSLYNDASLVPSYKKHILTLSSLWRSLKICITSGKLIVCISAALVFTLSSMPVPKSCE